MTVHYPKLDIKWFWVYNRYLDWLKEFEMAVVHNVQVYPVYNTIVQVHRVLHEREYDTAEGARLYVETYNAFGTGETHAVYTGAIDTETGENL